MSTVTDYQFGTGNGVTTVFTLTETGGATALNPAISFMYRTDWQGKVTMLRTSRTNLFLGSTLAGSSPTPTQWSVGGGTGTNNPATSIFTDGSAAWIQTASATRPFIVQTVALAASTTYCISVLVETITAATFTAIELFLPSALQGGWTESYPVCTANPSGGSGGVITTGILKYLVTTDGTGGNLAMRVGLGGAGAATGSLQFSRPQCEINTTRGSFIATTSATASATDYSIAASSVTFAVAPINAATLSWTGSSSNGESSKKMAPSIGFGFGSMGVS